MSDWPAFVVMFQKISTLADIVSCSWGFGPADAPMSTALRDAIATLARHGRPARQGLVICIAAGNNNCPVQDLANTRTYRYRDRVRPPQLQRTDRPVDRRTPGRDHGQRQHVAQDARGLLLLGPADLRVRRRTTGTTSAGISAPDAASRRPTTRGSGSKPTSPPESRFTDDFGGTSSATPTVAGVCAGWSCRSNPCTDWRGGEDNCSSETADKDMSLDDGHAGERAGRFRRAGFSLWFGYGKVNAFKAVQGRRGADRSGVVDTEATPNLEHPGRRHADRECDRR